MRRISESVRRLEIVLVKCLHYSRNFGDNNNGRRQEHRPTRHHSKRAKEEKYIKELEQQKKVNKTAHFDMSWMKQLPDPPYALPKSPVFALERSGCYSKEWLMQQWDEARHQTYAAKEMKVMDKETFWSLPAHEALDLIARTQPYHDTLELIMEHSWFWLFEIVIHAQDVPLPHVVYADFMKCCTFSSLQVPPEYQFALAPSLLRSLLCLSAYYCTIDKYYFTSVHMMYQMMEQQQHSSSELLSSWVYVCTAANKLEIALSYAQELAERNVEFDKTVFALMQHPSFNPLHITHRGMLNSETELEIREDYSLLHEGFIMQQRLCEQMKQNYGSDSIVVHAMFVYYALTLRHDLKWEVIRLALERHIVLTERTWQLLMSVFVLEKGIRCGAETVKAIVFALVEKIVHDRAQAEFTHSSASTLEYDDFSSARSSFSASLSEREMRYISEAMYILLRCRRNEHIPVLRHLPSSVQFDEDEVQYIVSSIRGRPTEHVLHFPETEHIYRDYESSIVDNSATEQSTLPLREKNTNATYENYIKENEHSDLKLVVPVLQELLHSDGDHVGVMKGIAEVVKMLQVKETCKAIPENTNVQIRPIDTSEELFKKNHELARSEEEEEEEEKEEEDEQIIRETHNRSYERQHEEQMSKENDKVKLHNSSRLKQLNHSERVFATLVSTLMEMEQNEGMPTVNCENSEKLHATDNVRELQRSKSDSHLSTQKLVDPLSFSLDRHRATSDTYEASLQHLVADEQFSALCNYTQQRQQEDEAEMKYMRHLPHAWVSPEEMNTEFESGTQSSDDMINNEFSTHINDENSTAAVEWNNDGDDDSNCRRDDVQNVVSNYTYLGSDSENSSAGKKR